MADSIAKGGIPAGFTIVKKWGSTPDDVEQSMAAQGMGSNTAGVMWGPGRPANPAWGYGGQPRKIDFQPGHNITNRPMRDGRVSFDALKQLTHTWDMASICITRRINDVRSLGWSVKAMDGVSEDVSTAIAYATQKVKYPEGPGSKLKYNAWVAKFLQSVLRYDAGCLYKRRDRADRVCGLSVVPGATIAPLLDAWGGTPIAPAPAYTQWIRGQAVKQLTAEEIIYEPFMPQDDSAYGEAPLESVVLSANTDLRAQAFLLSHFTAGTVPEGFAKAPPDLTSPDQVTEWQQWWDATMYGDDEAKHQLKWVPAGTDFEFPKDRQFDDKLAKWMAGKCAAAFGQTMNDLGFTEDVNRATGDTQVDVQFRVGTLPYLQYIEGIFNSYLQDDLQLPVEFVIDTGLEDKDRLQSAQVDKIDIESGVISPDEVRERRGLAIDNERPTPRFVMHSRRGPIPLLEIISASGKIDAATYGPAQEQPLLADGANPIVSVVPDLGTDRAKVDMEAMNQAQDAARAQLHPDAPPLPAAEPLAKALERIVKEATAGITVASGFTGDPLTAGRPNPRRKDDKHQVVPLTAVAKAVTVAGLMVKAADTGRVVLLQRALTEGDPAGGSWEAPGGHIQPGEDPLTGACREWAEEVGCRVPPGTPGGTWTSPNGVYQGCVWVVPSEETVTINPGPDGRAVQPDSEDEDLVETVAWWDPADLPGLTALRPELAADIGTWLPVVQAAGMREATQVRKDLAQWRNVARRRVTQTGGTPADHFVSGAIPTSVHKMVSGRLATARTRDDVDAAFRVVVKARGQGKARRGWREGSANTPQCRYDLQIADHYQGPILAALGRYWTRGDLTAAVSGTALPAPDVAPLRTALEGLAADAWAAGRHAADLQIKAAQRVRKDDGDADVTIDWGAWEPGHLDAAILTEDGGFAAVLAQTGTTIRGITATALDRIGGVLSEGLLNGDSAESMGRALRAYITDPDRAELIAVTESARIVETASMATYSDNGVREWDWLVSDGACPRCLDEEAKNPHPVSETSTIPLHPRCLPGTARVVVPGNVLAGLPGWDAIPCVGGNGGLHAAPTVAEAAWDGIRANVRAATDRHYVGDLVTIRLASGHELTATPNHPVATPGGWVPIAELQVGQDVLCSTGAEWVPVGNPDVDDVPPTIQEVAESLPVLLGPVPTAAEDFHGDGAGSQVHVVRADGLLGGGVDPAIEEEPGKVPLGFRDAPGVLANSLNPEGTTTLLVESDGPATHDGMGGVGEPESFLGRGLGHANVHGIAAASGLNALIKQTASDAIAVDAELAGECQFALSREVAPGDLGVRGGLARMAGDTGGIEGSVEGLLVDAKGPGELLDIFPGLIATSEVVHVESHAWSGHVFNLETVGGWYVADGVVTHNCRCSSAPVWSSIE